MLRNFQRNIFLTQQNNIPPYDEEGVVNPVSFNSINEEEQYTNLSTQVCYKILLYIRKKIIIRTYKYIHAYTRIT